MQNTTRISGWLIFFAAIIASWWGLYAMAQQMGLTIFGVCAPGASEALTMPVMTQFIPLFLMWSVMMIAMMFPSMVPTLSTYEKLIRSANGTRAGWWGIVIGYFIIWVIYAALMSGLQLLLRALGLVDIMGQAASPWISAGLALAIGLYQFSALKETCHSVCLSPMTYFLSQWSPTGWGGFRMGWGLGIYCIGCCWGYMALGFIGGTMNLLWMGAATLIIIVEKLPEIGSYLRIPFGFGFIGLSALISAYALFG